MSTASILTNKEDRPHLAIMETTLPDVRAEQRPARVVLAEDDVELRRLLAAILRFDGYEVVEIENGVQCVDYIQSWVLGNGAQSPPDLIISDIRLPGSTGLALLKMVRSLGLSTPVILTTAFGAPETHTEANRLGAAAVFDKPFDIAALEATVRRLLR